MNYLKVDEFNTQTFYIIPKIHKNQEDPSGWPIVSAIRGPLEQVGKYIDSLIKDLVSTLPLYVRDTGDVFNKIKDLTFPGEVLPVGIGVEALYTSIPHEWGISAVYHFLDKKFPTMEAQNEFVIELLDLALKHNISDTTTNNYAEPIWGHPGYLAMPASIWDGGRRRLSTFLRCTLAMPAPG